MVENHQTARFHPPVRYTVRFPEPRTHYLSVEARLPTEGQSEVEIFCNSRTRYEPGVQTGRSLHAGRVISVFRSYTELIEIAREQQKSRSTYYELQAVATRWRERKSRQENALNIRIKKLEQEARKTERPVFK